MKNIANDHFDTEKPHTKIKHRLFKSALDTSLSIANGINYSKKENKPYILTYLLVQENSRMSKKVLL